MHATRATYVSDPLQAISKNVHTCWRFGGIPRQPYTIDRRILPNRDTLKSVSPHLHLHAYTVLCVTHHSARHHIAVKDTTLQIAREILVKYNIWVSRAVATKQLVVLG